MDSFRDLEEKIGHVDRPHTIEDVKEMLSSSQKLNEFVYALRGTEWSTGEKIKTPYSDLTREFNVGKMTIGEFKWALKTVKEEYYDRMQNPIVIYRYVGGNPSEIDEEDLGHCWARSTRGVIGYLKNQQDYLGSSRKLFSGSDKPCGTMFVGKTTLDNIDWVAEALLNVWGWDTSEEELRVWNPSEVEIVQKKVYTSREMDSILNGTNGFNLDAVDVSYSTSGETQPFSWFKDTRNSERKIHYAYYNLLCGKDTDEEWCDERMDELVDDYIDEKGKDAYKELMDKSIVSYLMYRTDVSEENRREAEELYDSLIYLGDSMPKEKADSVNWQETMLSHLFGKAEIIYKK